MLRLFHLRFSFLAVDPIWFPAGKPGNILRGALGIEFRNIVCDPDCAGPRHCQRRAECLYARVFEPSSTGHSPSGLKDWPRPFVFRANHLDGRCLKAGGRFHFDLHLFLLEVDLIRHFVASFARLADDGLGPRRGRASLSSVDQIGGDGSAETRLYDRGTFATEAVRPAIELDLAPGEHEVTRVGVDFETPTELKAEGKLVEKPEFRVLFARCRDRVSTLRSLYQNGPLRVDFRNLGGQAAAIRMTRCAVEWREIERRSSRTGQTHPLGGFVGSAEYEGSLRELLPLLEAAQWTGVGRHTVWGKGALRVRRL